MKKKMKKKKKKKINNNNKQQQQQQQREQNETNKQTKIPLKENFYFDINDLNAIKEPHSQVFTPAGCRQLNKANET